MDICSTCKGHGFVLDDVCEFCEGDGIVGNATTFISGTKQSFRKKMKSEEVEPKAHKRNKKNGGSF